MNAATWINAPATTMLASCCAVCAHPLLDAESVERGIGPDCAKKYGYGSAAGVPSFEAAAKALGEALPIGDAHAIANSLVHRIACEQRGAFAGRACAALSALGYDKLARRIARRLGSVEITREGELLLVKTPRGLDDDAFRAFVSAMSRLRGARWDGERKLRAVPIGQRRELWAVLRRCLPAGTIVAGERMGST